VVSDTLAALTLSGAWLIGAIALGFIDPNLAFHYEPLLQTDYLLGKVNKQSYSSDHFYI
jgi:hypothetical protein